MPEPSGLRRALLLLLALAGCAETKGGAGPDAAAPAAVPDAAAPAVPSRAEALLRPPDAAGAATGRAPLRRPEALDAPDVYMALQQDNAGVVSVVFAIDASRDNTPSDDPAIRLTPEGGRCNPQELRRFAFPEVYAARPVFSAIDAADRVGSRELPAFMAIAVSTEMIRLGLAARPEDTHPQNVCTYKLWQRLVAADATARVAGQ